MLFVEDQLNLNIILHKSSVKTSNKNRHKISREEKMNLTFNQGILFIIFTNNFCKI